MRITPKTKIKDLIPEGYEIKDVGLDFNIDTNVCEFISIPIKRKSKALDDYENELTNKNEGIIFNSLKSCYPQQYYSIILQMIADDICHINTGKDFCFHFDPDEGNVCVKKTKKWYLGVVCFDTEEHAKQALEILGDKIEYLL